MTDTIDAGRIEEALEVIDRVLVGLSRRELVSGTEVTDLLLDLRSLLATAAAEPAGVH